MYPKTYRLLLISLCAALLLATPALAAPANPAGSVGAQRMAPTVTATVGAGGDYTTLKAAFDAINSGALTGSVQLDVIGNTTETTTAVLNASGAGSASYTDVRIQPSGGAARTINGAISGNALVTLNGADNVTIDGLNAGGNALTLSNASTSVVGGTSTLKFIADATNNTVTNASILGSATINVASGTDGGNIWFSTGSGTGNDNNLISYCNIGPAGGNLPARLIWGRGGALADNSNVTISDNNLYDYFAATLQESRGIDISTGNTDWILANNRFYQTAPRNTAQASTHTAIWVFTNDGNNFQITGNTIGYADSTGAGVYTLTGTPGTFYAIYLTVGTTTASSVQGNTIAGISITSSANIGRPMSLIYVAAGLVNIGDVAGNTLGGQTGTGSIFLSTACGGCTVSGIYNAGQSSTNISNNTIGSIALTNSSTGWVAFRGIWNTTSASAATTIANNTVGGASAGSIANNATGASSSTVGIQTEDSTPTISGNTVRNMTMVAGAPGALAEMIGINQQAASPSFPANIAQNTVHSLVNSNPSAAVWVTGLQYTGPTSGTNLVQRNLIYNLSTLSSSATARVNGIYVQGGVTTYQNNMIALGSDMTANSPQIYGIAETGGTDNFYYNSVYIGGAGVAAGSANSFAFQSTIQNNTRDYRNNIFYNARSNSGATGKHYAISVGGAAPNPTGLTSNYNCLYASGTGGFTGLFNGADRLTLANWQTATGQDANSISADPQFVSTTDLHINSGALRLASPVENAGTPIAGVTIDFDGGLRSATTPDIGADEVGVLSVTLASFTAQGGADRVTVAWETVSEIDNAGFNLYRAGSAAGPQTLLTYVPSQGPGSSQGFAYSYEDLAVQPGQTYWYWLEDVSLSGATTLHGPVSATVQAPTAVTLSGLQAIASPGPGPLTALFLALLAGAAGLIRRQMMLGSSKM